MIKFFRKIRQKLLSEGKVGRYFTYAIGEIILVVIGILIALSLNNWNENRKIQNQKKEILSSLNEEFKKNLSELDLAISSTENVISASNLLLLNLNGSINKSFKGEKLDSLLFEISDFPIWKRSDFNIDVIQNSNIFNQSEDSQIMQLVYQWKALIESTKEFEKRGESAFQYYINYIKKNGSWREIDKYMWDSVKESTILPSNDHLLLEPEFENCINSIFIWSSHKNNRYKEIRLVVEDILVFTNKNSYNYK